MRDTKGSLIGSPTLKIPARQPFQASRPALVVLACLLLAFLMDTASAADPAPSPVWFNAARGPHYLPTRGRALPRRAAAINSIATSLDYYGGRVVSNVQVVQVLWGQGAYIPEIAGTTHPSMADFFTILVASPYMDWLAEYNTQGVQATAGSQAGSASSNQTIGRGTYLGQYLINPSVTKTSITDAEISGELATQINAKLLPAPTLDPAGNTNTYYAIFFPPGITIDDGPGNVSCVDYCAYHSTAQAGSMELYYGVHPDAQAGSGCATGCGATTPFANTTASASHELAETVTDPETGLASTPGPPLAWWDNANDPQYSAPYGEIGDICNQFEDQILGPDGASYNVQEEFSNALQSCVPVQLTPAALAVNLRANPAAVTAGSALSLSWAAPGPGVSCTATGGSLADGWGGAVGSFGSKSVSPATPGQYTYGLNCSGSGQPAQTQVITDVFGMASYDPVSGQVSLPLVTIGGVGYANLVLMVGSIVTAPSGTSPASVAYTYDPSTNELVVPGVTLGTSSYYNVVVTAGKLVSIGGASGIDSYDGAQLTAVLRPVRASASKG